MTHGFTPLDLAIVWAGAMALGALTLHVVNLLLDRGVQLDVNAPTLVVFSIAARGSWALNAVAATLVLVQPLLDVALPFSPWVLGAAVSPLALPLGRMRRLLREKLSPAASVRLSS